MAIAELKPERYAHPPVRVQRKMEALLLTRVSHLLKSFRDGTSIPAKAKPDVPEEFKNHQRTSVRR